jgi:MFS family permease
MTASDEIAGEADATRAAGLKVASLLRVSRSRVVMLCVTVLVIATIVAGFAAFRVYERVLGPELLQTARIAASTITATASRAIDLGLEPGSFVGMDEFMSDAMAPHRGLLYAAMLDDGWNVIAATAAASPELLPERPVGLACSAGSMTVAEPVQAIVIPLCPSAGESGGAGGRSGMVTAAILVANDPAFVNAEFQILVLDVATALLIGLLLAFEILLVLIMLRIAEPLNLLVDQLSRLAHGDVGITVRIKGSDEVSTALASIDRAVGSIHDHIALLKARIGAVANPDQRDRLAARLQDLLGRLAIGADGLRTLKSISPWDVRLPLVLFVLADEMQKAFLPLYSRALSEPVFGLSAETISAMPLTVYMAVIALATPSCGRFADRFGARRMVIWGLVPAIAGYIVCAIAPGALWLIGGRGLTALGYAIITIACQSHIVAAAGETKRSLAMTIFIGALMTASICGTAVGGIVADRVGPSAAFATSAAIAALAGIIAWRMVPPSEIHPVSRRSSLLAAMRDMLLNPAFLAFLILAAIPSKIALTGILFYLVPLRLSEIGAGQADIARVLIIYSFMNIAAGPVVSRFADRWNAHFALMIAGGALSGAGAWALADVAEVHLVLLIVACLGIGHALCVAPGVAFATKVCQAESERHGRTTMLGVLRMMERIGSVAGPAAAAAIAAIIGFGPAVGAIGAFVVVASLVHGAVALAVPVLRGVRPVIGVTGPGRAA